MPLQAMTVSIPMRLGFHQEGPIIPMQVEAVATTPAAAIATAKVLITTHCQLEYHSRPGAVLQDRAHIGPAMYQVNGLYGYCFVRGDRIVSLQFAAKCQSKASIEMAQSLAGIQQQWCHGLVFDCAQLQQIDSAGLSCLVHLCRQLPCHLCRVPKPIYRLIKQIGLDKHLPMHADLNHGLQAMLKGSLTNQITARNAKKAKEQKKRKKLKIRQG